MDKNIDSFSLRNLKSKLLSYCKAKTIEKRKDVKDFIELKLSFKEALKVYYDIYTTSYHFVNSVNQIMLKYLKKEFFWLKEIENIAIDFFTDELIENRENKEIYFSEELVGSLKKFIDENFINVKGKIYISCYSEMMPGVIACTLDQEVFGYYISFVEDAYFHYISDANNVEDYDEKSIVNEIFETEVSVMALKDINLSDIEYSLIDDNMNILAEEYVSGINIEKNITYLEITDNLANSNISVEWFIGLMAALCNEERRLIKNKRFKLWQGKILKNNVGRRELNDKIS